MTKANKLTKNPVHLGLKASALVESEIDGMQWYEDYTRRHKKDGFEARLVAMYTFSESWDSWEVHPNGAEVVICTEGEMTLIQDLDGKENKIKLKKGDCAINEAGVWHTADVEGAATAIFITAGVGTQHKPR